MPQSVNVLYPGNTNPKVAEKKTKEKATKNNF